MPQIPTTYTGKNSGAAPIYSGNKTESAIGQGLNQLLRAKSQDVAFKREEESKFLEAIKVDPISVAAENVTVEQASMIEEFNDKWSNIYAERKGVLNTSDKAAMHADKLALQSWQGQKQSQYERYLNDVQLYARSSNEFDAEEFQKRSAQYLVTGDMPPEGLLDYAALPYQDYVDGLESVATRGNVYTGGKWGYQGFVPGQSGVGYEVWGSKWDEGDARKAHEEYVLSNPRSFKTAQRYWDGLTENQKLSMLDAVDANNNGAIDKSERQNAILEADFQRHSDLFLGSRRKPRSQQTRVTQDISDSPESKEQRVLSRGGGEGVTKGTDFQYAEEGLSSQWLGSGVGGVSFSYTDDVRDSWGVQIPTSVISDKPEDADIKGQYVLAKPVVAANGKVEWIAYGGKKKEITATEYLSNQRKEGYVKVKGADGESIYYKIDKMKNIPVTTTYGSTSGILDTYFPGFRALARAKGIDQVPKTKDGKIDILNID